VPEDEDQVVLFSAIFAPLEVMLGGKGFAVFVEPEEAAIKIEAGKLEVVGITAEDGRLLLGREDQADIGE